MGDRPQRVASFRRFTLETTGQRLRLPPHVGLDNLCAAATLLLDLMRAETHMRFGSSQPALKLTLCRPKENFPQLADVIDLPSLSLEWTLGRAPGELTHSLVGRPSDLWL